ncbi:DUF6924 domain-containing protein [Antrihabitans spumae]|uniref:DUF6924 domain-containing protein n=1 Tax=Antrihabitans spumae TaxID=3373370 RepID=A0ABW7KPP9_9NOCA
MSMSWEQVRGLNYGTMGRSISAIMHQSNGGGERVRHSPAVYWRIDDESGEPVHIENATDVYRRATDGGMLHRAKTPYGFESRSGFPSRLFRAYESWPPPSDNELHPPDLLDPTEPRAVQIRGRDGWEVTFRHQHSADLVTYVIDAELGLALSWRYRAHWMELENPCLDEQFSRDIFTWTGPTREEDLEAHEREYIAQIEKQRLLDEMPRALPTWLPIRVGSNPSAGDPRTGALDLGVYSEQCNLVLRRWVTDIGEPKLEWPMDITPARHRQETGAWTYEIRSNDNLDVADCARIIDSIVPVDPPEREPHVIAAELDAERSSQRNAEITELLGTGRVLEDHFDGESLLIRTDFSDDAAWRSAALAALAPPPGNDDFGAALTCIDNREYDRLTVDHLLALIAHHPTYYAFLFDNQTITDPEQTVLVVDTSPNDDDPERPRGRTFRTIPEKMFAIEANLSLANMDFGEYADAADKDGVFRGFAEPVARLTGAEMIRISSMNTSTGALQSFHESMLESNYPYDTDLYERELTDLHQSAAVAMYDERWTIVGYQEYLDATAGDGAALSATVPMHDGGWWTVALAPDDRRPLAAMLVVPPPAVPAERDGSGPRVVRIPFDPPAFVSLSALTDDDPLVDRDAMRRAVIDAAGATYGSDRVSGGYPVLLRIPQIPGFLAGCHVTVSGEDIFYTAVVTDTDNEFIVYESPPEGIQFIGPD